MYKPNQHSCCDRKGCPPKRIFQHSNEGRVLHRPRLGKLSLEATVIKSIKDLQVVIPRRSKMDDCTIN